MCTTCVCTGGACRTRATKVLAKKYSTPKEAEKKLSSPLEATEDAFSQLALSDEGNVGSPLVSSTPGLYDLLSADLPSHLNLQAVDSSSSADSITLKPVDSLQDIFPRVRNMSVEDQMSFVSDVFNLIAEQRQVFVPLDYLRLSLEEMKQLQRSGRSNLLYGLARGLGTH